MIRDLAGLAKREWGISDAKQSCSLVVNKKGHTVLRCDLRL